MNINTVNLFPPLSLSLSLSVNGLIKPTSPIMLRQYVEDHLQINNLSGVKLNIIFAKFQFLNKDEENITIFYPRISLKNKNIIFWHGLIELGVLKYLDSFNQ